LQKKKRNTFPVYIFGFLSQKKGAKCKTNQPFDGLKLIESHITFTVHLEFRPTTVSKQEENRKTMSIEGVKIEKKN